MREFRSPVRWLCGSVYRDGSFAHGSVGVEDGIVVSVTRQDHRDAMARGLVIPAFVNHHTHLADAVVRQELRGTLEEIVAPPYGLKHRELEGAKEVDVVAAIRGAIDDLVATGSGSFWDFREGGLVGLRTLLRATLGLPASPVAYGRPSRIAYDRNEVAALLRVADGIGISSVLDWPRDDAEKLARDCRRAGKGFATHCSERVREEIDAVLDLDPAFLVHMLEATEADLERCVDARVPIVVCPRSNVFFGKVPDLPRLLRIGVDVRLGTDNAMVNAPSMLREMEFAYKIARLRGRVDARDILAMALRGRGRDAERGIREGDPADLVVFDLPGDHAFAALLRAVETNIALVMLGGRVVGPQPQARSPKSRRGPAPRNRSRRRRTRSAPRRRL